MAVGGFHCLQASLAIRLPYNLNSAFPKLDLGTLSQGGNGSANAAVSSVPKCNLGTRGGVNSNIEIRISNGANGTSDMEGKAAREAARARGQRTSFKQLPKIQTGRTRRAGMPAGRWSNARG